MDEQRYYQTQSNLQLLAGIVRGMPLVEFVEAISRAETLGPIVDPTLYRDGAENLARIKRLAQGLIPFQHAVWINEEESA